MRREAQQQVMAGLSLQIQSTRINNTSQAK
jgi:hypothetical protein